jgi:hypothetical protein
MNAEILLRTATISDLHLLQYWDDQKQEVDDTNYSFDIIYLSNLLLL